LYLFQTLSFLKVLKDQIFSYIETEWLDKN
jgi:hypothetical protein